jgi:cytochrome P450
MQLQRRLRDSLSGRDVSALARAAGVRVAGVFLQLKEDIIRPVADTVEAGNKIRERAGRDISTLFFNALAERETAPRDDVLSQLVQREQAGELTREDSINICHLLLIAGLDTVTGTLECAFALLARRPDLQRQLGDPDGIERAVEELLRWIVTSPAQSRVTTADTVIEGVAVAEGTVVRIVQATINFDPDRFENPTEVDLGRVSNRHASFGIGVHRCLGSHLARLELRIALAEWHRRVPAYQLPADYEVKYTQSLRGVTDLPLVIGSRP